MKLNYIPEMSFEKMTEAIREKLPQYETAIKKNPITKIQYVEVKKSGSVGVWIRVFEKKNQVMLIKAIPSALIRGLFGGLLLIAFVNGAQNKLRDEVGEVLMNNFNTTNI